MRDIKKICDRRTQVTRMAHEQQLKNMLIVIAVLVGLHYFISPYQQCMRDDYADGAKKRSIAAMCSERTDW